MACSRCGNKKVATKSANSKTIQKPINTSEVYFKGVKLVKNG